MKEILVDLEKGSEANFQEALFQWLDERYGSDLLRDVGIVLIRIMENVSIKIEKIKPAPKGNTKENKTE